MILHAKYKSEKERKAHFVNLSNLKINNSQVYLNLAIFFYNYHQNVSLYAKINKKCRTNFFPVWLSVNLIHVYLIKFQTF